jgi:preprotein translocase subunit SecE
MAKKESKNENKVKKHFFKDFKAELKKVIWPTPKQLFNSTVAVVTIVLISAVIVFALDVVFEFGSTNVISNLQNIVNEKYNAESETEDTEETESTSSDEDISNEENSDEESSDEENDVEEGSIIEQNSEETEPEENTEVPEEGTETNVQQ